MTEEYSKLRYQRTKLPQLEGLNNGSAQALDDCSSMSLYQLSPEQEEDEITA